MKKRLPMLMLVALTLILALSVGLQTPGFVGAAPEIESGTGSDDVVEPGDGTEPGAGSGMLPDNGEVDPGSGNGSPLSAPQLMAATYTDTIAVSKSAQQVQGCRMYEVTLGITGQPPQIPVDLVIVLDTSGSMGSGSGSPMEQAKTAASSLATTVLQNSANRVAVVTFDYQGHINPFTGRQYSYQRDWRPGDLDADSKMIRNFTNSISSVTGEINKVASGGGTNTEAGFIRARNVMQAGGRAGTIKAIVFLTDGLPTVSIGRSYGPDEPTTRNAHATAALTAAAGCRAQGYHVFTINLLSQIPSQCLALAREIMQEAQNAGYYEATTPEVLNGIYAEISQHLNYAATNAVVTDKINSDVFTFVDFAQGSQGASYNPSNGTITWNTANVGTAATLKYRIKVHDDYPGGDSVNTNTWARLSYTDINGNPNRTKDFENPEVSVPLRLSVDAGPDREIPSGGSVTLSAAVTGGTAPYSYQWAVSGAVVAFSTDSSPTVSPAGDTEYTVTVTDKDGCKASDTVKVTVLEDPKGTITVRKVVTRGSTDQKFTIYVEGNGHTWSMMLSHGESAVITGLALGEYTIWEVVPMDYKNISISPDKVTITADNLNQEVVVTNKKTNGRWFRRYHRKVNTFKLHSNWPVN